ncbi:hypothetical protein [Streptomyces sp. NPDC093094]|uniref:hypothetical protein n=1 Tax=Streptomyces sp. NPDC093094 TaxID=3366026 RepID=UPI0038212105
MSLPPFGSEDFEERCETCAAPPGQFCEPWCDTGYTAQDHHHDTERRAQTGGAPPTPPYQHRPDSQPQKEQPPCPTN